MEISDISALYITYSQGEKVIVDKSIQDITISAEKTLIVSLKLTQEDTLKFIKGNVEIQIRLKTKGGEALASKPINTYVDKILKDGVI